MVRYYSQLAYEVFFCFCVYSRIPVISPLSLFFGSSLSSNSFKKRSMPCVSTLLRPKKPLHSKPTAPIVNKDAARHGALGASGASGRSAGCIARFSGKDRHARRRRASQVSKSCAKLPCRILVLCRGSDVGFRQGSATCGAVFP